MMPSVMDEKKNNIRSDLACTVLGKCRYSNPVKAVVDQSSRLMTRLAHAIIVYPNLGCPTLLSSGKALSMYLLINDELVHNAYHAKKFPDDPCLLRNRLNLQLRYLPWDNLDPAQKGQAIHQARCFVQPSPNAYQALEVNEPQAVDAKKPLILLDAQGQVVARIAAQLATHYHRQGFKHWLRVTWLKPAIPVGLYHVIWFSLKSEEDNNLLSVDRQMYEPQDELMLLGLKPYAFQHAHAFQISEPGSGLAIDTNQPIQSYHPLYVNEKAYLNLGHLTDIHLSSRQHALQKNKIQVIPGVSSEESPFIHELIHNTYDSIKDLFDQIGQNADIDCLVLTGDFVDYAFNLQSRYTTISPRSPSELWEKLELSVQWQHETLLHTHELGVDQITFYSFILYFYRRYKKPIFIVGGNHDGYRYPFGISPRIRSLITSEYSEDHQDKVWFEKTRANASIPLDHNLTFFEALLVFGPGYRDLITANNFDPSFQLLLWHLFNPLNDWKVIYNNQCFVGLGWGDAEHIPVVADKIVGAGVLPRASDALSPWQWQLLKELPDTQYCVLMMHAPILNFAANIPLYQEKQAIQIIRTDNYTIEDSSPYDQGSFRYYKKKFFQEILAKKKITHALSGHSHRSALYCCPSIESCASEDKTHTMLICKYQAYPLEEISDPQQKIGKLTRLIVTGSAGPISNVNHDQALGGVGATPPTGTLLFFSAAGDTIKPIASKIKTAKPRLAALLDYYDIEYSKKGFYLPHAQSLNTFNAYHFDCDPTWPQPVPLFREAKLYYYFEGKWKHVDLNLSTTVAQDKCRYRMKFDRNFLNNLLKKEDQIKILLLSFIFNPTLSSTNYYKNYNITAPWQFPVQFRQESSANKHILARPKFSKERPNFKFYQALYA